MESKLIYPSIILQRGKSASITRRHPWIFSGAIHHKDNLTEGDTVRVLDYSGKFLCTGHYHDSSIAVRILSYEDVRLDEEFWNGALEACSRRRVIMGFPNSQTNSYRLVNGEGDDLSGLIVDIYDNIAVIQCHTPGMLRNIEYIAEALKNGLGRDITIYNKSRNTLPSHYSGEIGDGFISGNQSTAVARENDHYFQVDIVDGQKTGFFLDQRENRKLLSGYVSGKKILNLYCYTGGFSIYALRAGATLVQSVDVSEKALQLLEKNIELNQLDYSRHQSISGDVKNVLKDIPEGAFDIIVVDPPAFAKSAHKSHNAVQAYKRINAMALSKIKQGGLLFTFSCSQVIDQVLFQNTITAAAIESGKNARILHLLSQSPDHPISIFHPEGKYLKGLVLHVS